MPETTAFAAKPRFEILDGLRGVAALMVVAFHLLETFSGEISYPIYITHFPLVYLQASWAGLHPNATVSQCIAVSAAPFFLAIFNAYAALKLYDLPIRAWLSGRGK